MADRPRFRRDRPGPWAIPGTQRQQDRRGQQLGGHPDQPQRQRRDDRQVVPERRSQRVHEDPLAHPQARRAAPRPRSRPPWPGRRWRSTTGTQRQVLDRAQRQQRRTTSIWLRPRKTQAAAARAAPGPGARPRTGAAPRARRRERQADQERQPAEDRRQDHDQEAQAQPQAEQAGQMIETQLDAAQAGQRRPRAEATARAARTRGPRSGRRPPSSPASRRTWRSPPSPPRAVGHGHPRPHHHHHRLARHVLAQVADQVGPHRRPRRDRRGARREHLLVEPPATAEPSQVEEPEAASQAGRTWTATSCRWRSCQVRSTCRPTAHRTTDRHRGLDRGNQPSFPASSAHAGNRSSTSHCIHPALVRPQPIGSPTPGQALGSMPPQDARRPATSRSDPVP